MGFRFGSADWPVLFCLAVLCGIVPNCARAADAQIPYSPRPTVSERVDVAEVVRRPVAHRAQRGWGCSDRYSCYPLYGAYGPYGGVGYWGAYTGWYR